MKKWILIGIIIVLIIITTCIGQKFIFNKEYVEHQGKVIDVECSSYMDSNTYTSSDEYKLTVKLEDDLVIKDIFCSSEIKLGQDIIIYEYDGHYSVSKEGSLLESGNIVAHIWFWTECLLMTSILFVIINVPNKKTR